MSVRTCSAERRLARVMAPRSPHPGRVCAAWALGDLAYGAASDQNDLPSVVDPAPAGDVASSADSVPAAVEVGGTEVRASAPGGFEGADLVARRAAASALTALERAVAAGPSPSVVAQLVAVPGALLGPADRVRLLRCTEACVAWLQSRSLELTAAVADAHVARAARTEAFLAAGLRPLTSKDRISARQLAQESAAADVAGALRISRGSAHARIQAAVALRESFPLLGEALRTGRTSLLHVLAAGAETVPLTAAQREAVDRLLAGPAQRLPVGAFRRRAKGAVLRVQPPEELARRHAEAVAARGVSYLPEDDGMGTVAATLPAPQARTVWLALDALARAHRRDHPDDARTLDALRADAFRDLVLSPPGGGAGSAAVQAQVQVQVAIDLPTLLGLADNPVELAGHGPLPADLGRLLASDGAWQRFVTDPLTGALLDAAPRRYRPSRALGEFVRLRDGGDTSPGAATRAIDCDADHATPFREGGPTVRANLATTGRRSHHLHTFAGWLVSRDEAGGTTTWTSPFGSRYPRSDPPLLPHLDRRDHGPAPPR